MRFLLAALVEMTGTDFLRNHQAVGCAEHSEAHLLCICCINGAPRCAWHTIGALRFAQQHPTPCNPASPVG